MFYYKLDNFSFQGQDDSGCCSLCYKALTGDPEYIKLFQNSKKLCGLINKSFKNVVKYVNNEIKLSLEERALSARFQKNMNNKYVGSFLNQKDVLGFGSSVRQLQQEYQAGYTGEMFQC